METGSMLRLRPKRPRLRLDPESYRRLHLQVLERDNWRCQHCGRMRNLEVHHQTKRSQLGPDSPDNLITLCSACHQRIHHISTEKERNSMLRDKTQGEL